MKGSLKKFVEDLAESIMEGTSGTTYWRSLGPKGSMTEHGKKKEKENKKMKRK